MNTPTAHDRLDTSVSVSEWMLAAVMGLALAVAVWWPLVQGGGLVGGDVYPYFLPQKVVLAEGFAKSEIPLWHNRTGLGYPLLAESQAGVFYPPHQVLYRLLDVNSAYNANVLLHYWLAFVFAWRFARCQGISTGPALLTSLVFVYGWFPARISWEWSIFGGVYFPLTMWLTDRLVRRPGRGRFATLAVCFAIHLLAGHFTLAFINQLTAVTYAGLWMLFDRDGERSWRRRSFAPVLVVASVLTAMLLAAVQLVPTYELKRLSQRSTSTTAASAAGDTPAFDPAFGHLPPLYLTQVVASWWYWHSPEIVASGGIQKTPLAIAADTNVVEAHLYWGLIPFGLLLLLLRRSLRKRVGVVRCRIWCVLVVASLAYSTGWLLPITRHLPGFSFFNGPGRYTMVSALGGAILAGMVLDALLTRSGVPKRILVTLAVCGLTLPDLLWSAQYVADAQAVSNAPLALQEQSWLRQQFAAAEPLSVRLLAPGPNVANLFGVSSVPEYLGLGPQVYYDESLWPPTGPESAEDEFPAAEQLRQMAALGITHVLTTEALINPSPQIELIAAQPDALLNTIWGRGAAPCYLYRVLLMPARIEAIPEASLTSFQVLDVSANRVRFEVDLKTAADVQMKELMYPGWRVQVDNVAVLPINTTGLQRTVFVPAGRHTIIWAFRPASVWWGTGISVITALALTVCCGFRTRLCHSGPSSANL